MSQTVYFNNPADIVNIFNQLVTITNALTGINQSIVNLEPEVYNNGLPNPLSLPDLSIPAERDMYEGIPDNIKTSIKSIVSGMSMTGLAMTMSHSFTFLDSPASNFGAISQAPGFDILSYINTIANQVNMTTGTFYGGNKEVQSVAPIFSDSLRGVAAFEMQNAPHSRQEACTFDPDATYNFHVKLGQLLNQLGQAGVYGPQADHGADLGHGRAEETMGEDGLLCYRMMQAKITGLQSQKVAATLKHVFEGVQSYYSSTSFKDLRESFISGYKGMKDAWYIMMGAYGLINGIPQQASAYIQKTIVRNYFQFNGVIMSDAATSSWLPRLGTFNSTDFKDLVLQQLNAGIDQFLIDTYPGYGGMHHKILRDLVAENKVSRARLEESAQRILIAKYKQGCIPTMSTFVNRVITNPTGTVAAVINDSDFNNQVLTQARNAIVLCKNDGILPLNKSTAVGFVGPAVKSRSIHLGTWIGDVEIPYTRLYTTTGLTKPTIEERLIVQGANYTGAYPYYTAAQMTGLAEKFPFHYFTGSVRVDGAGFIANGYKLLIDNNALPKYTYDDSEIADIISSVSSVSTVVVSLGWDIPTTHQQSDNQNTYGCDHTGTLYLEMLPPFQGVDLDVDKQKLLRGLLDAGKQVVVVYCGKKVEVIPYDILQRLSGFLYAGQLGSYGAQVIVETLYGDNNPTGRLSFSWPQSSSKYVHPYNNHIYMGPSFDFNNIYPSLEKASYNPAFPFAHGLSYGAIFTRTNMTGAINTTTNTLNVSYDLNNIGTTGTNELAACYGFNWVTNNMASRDCSYFLVDFKRVYVNAGQTVRVNFTATLDSLAIVPGDLHTQSIKQLLVPASNFVFVSEHNKQPNLFKYLGGRYRPTTAANWDFSGVLSSSAATSTKDFGIQINVSAPIFYDKFAV